MKEIKVNDKVCANCGKFAQYFEKGLHNFYVCGYGFCIAKNQAVEEAESYDCFCKREKKRTAAEDINNALNAVKELKKLLKK